MFYDIGSRRAVRCKALGDIFGRSWPRNGHEEQNNDMESHHYGQTYVDIPSSQKPVIRSRVYLCTNRHCASVGAEVGPGCLTVRVLFSKWESLDSNQST